MNLKVGIVGLPNAGKSTLFNALMGRQIAYAANFPFATIEPNKGIVPVPDKRLESLGHVIEETEKSLPPLVPATVEFIDIAGLVKGAHKGEGLGNAFLSHIRETDLILNVIRFFPDSDIVHVQGEIDPARDREIIETEMILADLATLERQKEEKGKKDDAGAKKWQAVLKLKKVLSDGIPARRALALEEENLVKDLHLLSMKPVLYIANLSEQNLSDNFTPGGDFEPFLPVSAKLESDLSEMPPEEAVEYLQSLGLKEGSLDRLIKKAYGMLGLISFLTAGVKEVRAWTIVKGTNAKIASGVIHTDFENKFIKAQVASFDDFIKYSGWQNLKEKGKVRFEGKEYIVRDGDVIEFKIGS